MFNSIIKHALKLEFCANLLDNGGNKTAGARTSSQTREAEWPYAQKSIGKEFIPRPPKIELPFCSTVGHSKYVTYALSVQVSSWFCFPLTLW